MKIYVVTQGEYSDYHIVTTFLDKKIANDFIKKMGSKINGYSSEYIVEEYEILSTIDEYKPKNECLKVTYRSDTKKIDYANKFDGYNEWEKNKTIYFYEEGFYIAIMRTPLTIKNVLCAEKTMSEWVAQIEYELQNTFDGDFKSFEKHYKNLPF